MALRTLSLVLLLLIVVFPAMAGAVDDPVLAKIGDHLFRRSDLERLLRYSPPELRASLENDPQRLATLIERVLEQRVLAEKARKEGFDKDALLQEQLRYITDDLIAREYIREKVLKEMNRDVGLTEKDLRAFYADNSAMFTVPEGRVKTFEEVKGFIEEQVRNRIVDQRVTNFIKKAAKEAGLEIYRERITGVTRPD